MINLETGNGGAWVKTSWIKNPPLPECGKTYEELKARARQSDHGEERLVVDRPDGSGADCYYREVKAKSVTHPAPSTTKPKP